jgi:hypothetical protein
MVFKVICLNIKGEDTLKSSFWREILQLLTVVKVFY